MYGKHILLGVCGSISNYKIAILIRHFIKEEAEVKVIMTPDATKFISPLTFSTLSKNKVYTSFENLEGDIPHSVWNNHVELGLWADIFLIAPATATTLSKLAQGLADNFLIATYLSARCPVYIAPAMDLDMWQHPSTQRNISMLISYGNTVLGPDRGELASGLQGEGRLREPEILFENIQEVFQKNQPFLNQNVLITAGPTRESIDPVRYITNHSSGKMGFSLAEELAKQGANVTLISGPTNLNIDHPYIKILKVNTALEMFEESKMHFHSSNLIILTAAVADYRPQSINREKIKSSEENLTLDLIKNPDIAKYFGEHKKPNQILIGFALESENEIAYAQKKLISKNLDLIVLNSIRDDGATFEKDTNKVTLINKKGEITAYTLKSKKEVAKDILKYIVNLLS